MSAIDLGIPRPRIMQGDFCQLDLKVVRREYLKKPKSIPKVDLFKTLQQRESRRSFGEVTKEQLSVLLWSCCHPTKRFKSKTGLYWEHRPVPSAGGKHPVEVIVINPTNSGWEPALYDPIAHCLCYFEYSDEVFQDLICDVDDTLAIQNGTVLCLAANFSKVRAAYHNPESLVWRDVGILIGYFTIVAEAIQLSCCPIGITGEPSLSLMLDSPSTIGVGGLIIGQIID